MTKLEATRDFTLGNYKRLSNIVRKNKNKEAKENEFFEGDIFECDDEMGLYLTGENDKKLIVAKIIETIPIKEEKPTEIKKKDESPMTEDTIIKDKKTKKSTKKNKK